jgi:hypothetical protein
VKLEGESKQEEVSKKINKKRGGQNARLSLDF